MAIKLATIDLDGALFNSGGTISPEILRTLRVAHGVGIKVVLASGRPLSDVMPFETQLGLEGSKEHAVVFSDAVVQDLSGKVLMSQKMDYHDSGVMSHLQHLAHVSLHFETTERLQTLNRDLPVQMQINTTLTDDEIRVHGRKETPQDFTSNRVGFTCPKGSNQIEKFWNSIPYWASESYGIVHNLDNCTELNGIEASKGNTLMNLAERLGISPEDVMAFGDQSNSVSMFGNPSFKKITMGNTIKDIKEKADFVTDDNNHSGIAKALKRPIV